MISCLSSLDNSDFLLEYKSQRISNLENAVIRTCTDSKNNVINPPRKENPPNSPNHYGNKTKRVTMSQ